MQFRYNTSSDQSGLEHQQQRDREECNKPFDRKTLQNTSMIPDLIPMMKRCLSHYDRCRTMELNSVSQASSPCSSSLSLLLGSTIIINGRKKLATLWIDDDAWASSSWMSRSMGFIDSHRYAVQVVDFRQLVWLYPLAKYPCQQHILPGIEVDEGVVVVVVAGNGL